MDRLKQHDVFYEASVSSVESAIREYIRSTHDEGVSYHDLAEFIVQRVSGEC